MPTQIEPPPAIAPWWRYFARMSDLCLMAPVTFIAIEIFKSMAWVNPVAAFALANPLIFDALVCLLWLFIEYLLLRRLGNTPGKALLGLRIKPVRSNARLWRRGCSVWWSGMGAGLPVVTPVCNLVAHFRLRKQGQTAWDANHGFVVLARLVHGMRDGLAALLILTGVGLAALQQWRWNDIQQRHEQLVDALNEGRAWAFGVEAYYRQHQKMPADLAGLTPPGPPNRLAQVSMDPNSGALHINTPLPGLENRSLLLIPHPTRDQQLLWECRGDAMPIEYLPAGCTFKPPPAAQSRAH